MAESPQEENKGKDKGKEKKMTPKEYLANLGFAMELIKSDPSLREWIQRVRKYMDENDGRTPTSYALDEMKEGIDWFERFNALQEEARMQQADPRREADWKRSLEIEQQKVRLLAQQAGAPLSDEDIKTIALDARLDGLTDLEIQQRMQPFIETAIVEGADLGGSAANFEREIVQWSRRNGLTLTGQTVARYVQAGVEGRSSIEDIKNDLRRTYLIGQYPGWADRIEQGYDPADIVQPYRERMANLLEIDDMDIDLNDNLLQRGMQSVGQDGKPRVMPLYEFEQEVRKDPRWQKTNNAYESYSRLADQVLSMFGLR